MKPSMSKPKIAILGGGPAGLGAAWQLTKQKKAEVTLFEQGGEVGGNAGSFEIDGIPVDYGSHRLHPACKTEILSDLKELLQDDLLSRPRHGRIRLRGRWIHFPLKPKDLLLNLPASFAFGVTLDSLTKNFHRKVHLENETFATVLERGLGKTICHDFYFPYAKKIWGIQPEDISPTQAYRRVSAGSLGKMARKILGVIPGRKSPMVGRFYYPNQGYGQISRAIAEEAEKLGADIQVNTAVKKITLGEPNRIEVVRNNRVESVEADFIWSTIPVSILARIVDPPAPPEVSDASKQIKYRAMILIYLVLEQQQFTPYDAHYFPEEDIKLTRLSEPKNYSARNEPNNRTILCGELPCMIGDESWNASDEELWDVVKYSLERCELAIKAPMIKVITKRLPFAYPIYQKGYEEYFYCLDEWVCSLDNVLTFGRQGLFAHDNTHHALAMAYAAVDCLHNGQFSSERWKEYRKEFETHVVED